MSYQSGHVRWAIDEPKPSWENETEYATKHKALLDDLREAATAAAKQDYDEADWLVNALTVMMHDVCRIAKAEYLKKHLDSV